MAKKKFGQNFFEGNFFWKNFPLGIIFIEKITLGENFLGKSFLWEKFP